MRSLGGSGQMAAAAETSHMTSKKIPDEVAEEVRSTSVSKPCQALETFYGGVRVCAGSDGHAPGNGPKTIPGTFPKRRSVVTACARSTASPMPNRDLSHRRCQASFVTGENRCDGVDAGGERDVAVNGGGSHRKGAALLGALCGTRVERTNARYRRHADRASRLPDGEACVPLMRSMPESAW
jgi:hypothetical protein